MKTKYFAAWVGVLGAVATMCTGCVAELQEWASDTRVWAFLGILVLFGILRLVWGFMQDEGSTRGGPVQDPLTPVFHSLSQLTERLKELTTDVNRLKSAMDAREREREPVRSERPVEPLIRSSEPVVSPQQHASLLRQVGDLRKEVDDKLGQQARFNREISSAMTSLGDEVGGLTDQMQRVIKGCEQLKSAVNMGNARALALNEGLKRVQTSLQGASAGNGQAHAFEEVTALAVERVASHRDDAGLAQYAERSTAICDLVKQLDEAAPQSLKAQLETTIERVTSISEGFVVLSEGARDGGLKVTFSTVLRPGGSPVADALKQIGEQTASLVSIAETQDSLWHELVETLVPSVIDLCDERVQERSRGTDGRDGSADFFRVLPGALEELAKAAGLQVIFPSRGTAFDPAVHAAVKFHRTDDESLRETVAACTSRGYRLDGQLLRKASVTLYR